MEQIMIEHPKLEAWLRTSFVADDGQVFLPCGAFDDELKAMLCVAHDGVSVVRHQGHLYVPASWLSEEYPRFADAIDTIVANIKRRMRVDAGESKAAEMA